MVNKLTDSVRSNRTNLNITAAVYSASEFSFNFAVKTKFLQYDNVNVKFPNAMLLTFAYIAPPKKTETYFIIIK